MHKAQIHTADADETVESRRVSGENTNSQLVGDSFVVSSVWTHASAVGNWVTADGCVVRSHRRICRQSSRIHVHTADANATRQNSFVTSAVCIGLKWLCQRQNNFNKYTVSQKTVQTYFFCQNFAKFRPIVKIFGIKIAERTSFSEVYSLSTSPNLCQRTTVRNADVQNCYITL